MKAFLSTRGSFYSQLLATASRHAMASQFVSHNESLARLAILTQTRRTSRLSPQPSDVTFLRNWNAPKTLALPSGAIEVKQKDFNKAEEEFNAKIRKALDRRKRRVDKRNARDGPPILQP